MEQLFSSHGSVELCDGPPLDDGNIICSSLKINVWYWRLAYIVTDILVLSQLCIVCQPRIIPLRDAGFEKAGFAEKPGHYRNLSVSHICLTL